MAKEGEMNWVHRKIYLYNVTFGLYMLDWWERFLFNTLIITLLWFVCYNGIKSALEFCRRPLLNTWWTYSFFDWSPHLNLWVALDIGNSEF